MHCHCESCRRATSSPMTTWISVPRSALSFTKGAPRYFSSSHGVRRGFCENCGSPLTYESERVPDEVHLCAASLTDPSTVSPSRHAFVAEQLPWLEVFDDLPRYAATSLGQVSPVGVGPLAKERAAR
ncbi:MAG: GFA family protein [Hyphomicrobiaceae bacterium]